MSKIIQLSDLHICKENGGDQQIEMIAQWCLSFFDKGARHVFLLGDIIDYRNWNDLSKLLTMLRQKQWERIEFCVGNHDFHPLTENKWHKGILKHYSSYVFGQKIYESFCKKEGFICKSARDYFIENTQFIFLESIRRGLSYKLASAGQCPHPLDLPQIDHSKKRILVTHHDPNLWGETCPVEVNFINFDVLDQVLTKVRPHYILCGHRHKKGGLISKYKSIPVLNGASNPSQGIYRIAMYDAELSNIEWFEKKWSIK